MTLIYEVRFGSEPWTELGRLDASAQPGSIRHIAPDGQRELIVFWCNGASSTVSISRGGIDEEIGPTERVIISAALDTVAELKPGEEFEMPVRWDKDTCYIARWRHEAP
jgi:hypothetical protein